MAHLISFGQGKRYAETNVTCKSCNQSSMKIDLMRSSQLFDFYICTNCGNNYTLVKEDRQ